MEDLVAILVPLGVCVALPVLVVWLVMRSKINSQNRNAEIMMEALKTNNSETIEVLKALMVKNVKTPLDKLMKKLTWGCALSLIGIGLIILCCIMGYDNLMEDDYDILFVGICCLGAGIGLLIAFFVNKRMLKKEDFSERKTL